MNELQAAILMALRKIAIDGPVDNTLGICGAVAQSLDDQDFKYHEEVLNDELTDAFKTWPNKSLSDTYPVGNWTMMPRKLFWAWHDNRRNMWAPGTRYGMARLELFNHTLKHFAEMENCQCFT